MKNVQANTEVRSFSETTNGKFSSRELRLLYKKISDIFENVSDYVFFLDLTGKIVDINKAALKLTRGLKEDLIGKQFVECIAVDSEVKTKAYDMLRKMLFGERLNLKTRFRNKSNQNVVIETSASYFRQNEKAVGILVIARDVTEQKMAEEEIRYEAEKYRSLVENAQDVIATFDLKGNLTSANKAIENYGFQISNIIGKNMFQFVSTKYWPKVMADVAKIASGKIVKSELEVITPIGKRVAEYQSNPIMNGNKVVGIQTVLRDITERKRIEEKLAENEECYKVLFEKSPIGICMITVNGKIINVNKKMEVITSYSSAELLKMSFFDLCKDPAVAMKTLEAIDGQDVVSELQIQVKCKDGKLIQIILTASKIQLRNNSFIQIRIQDMSELVMTEERLRSSEKKYKALFEEAMDAIFVADAETGIILDCNRAACQLVGREKSELIGKHQSILHPPQSIEDKFSRTFQLHRTEKEGQILEDRVVTKDGEIKEVSIKANVLELEKRKVVMGIFRDITEQKRIEEELVQERDFLQALMDNIPDTIYFKDKDSKFTKVNRAQATVLGVSDPKEAIGKTDFDFFTPEHARDAFEDEQRIIKTGQPLIGKIEKIRRADGQFRWVSATKTPIRDKNGKIIGLVGISRDITEQKQIEEKMEYQKNLFDALMDSMPDSIYFKDTQSRFIRVSKVSCAGIGVKNPDEAVGMTDFDWAPKELAEQYYADDQRVMKTGVPIVGQEEVSLSKVGKKWYSATKVPIRDKEGNVIGLVGISRDITKLKETEEELRHYSLHLEEIVEEKTRRL
ncbi:PAS domain S-box protein, partial [Candidatus Bathyarchaeota archaeon]|nr:PAS domain S-box protein [Candidatus Bathyarchaeota archaeon]